MVGQGESLRVLTVRFEQGKETGLPNAQNLLKARSDQSPLSVAIEQDLDLFRGEPLVNLVHILLPVGFRGVYHDQFTFQAKTVHFSGVNGSLLKFR